MGLRPKRINRVALVTALALVLAAPAARAQALVATRSESSATLTFQNRDITVFRASVMSRSPASRAEAAERYLSSLVRMGKTGPVATRFFQGAVLVEVDSQPVFALVPEDMDELAGETLDSVTALTVANLSLALREAAEVRTPAIMWRGVLVATLATLAMAALLWLLARLRRRVDARLAAEVERRIARPDNRSLVAESRLQDLLRWGVGALTIAAGLFIVYAWLTVVLRRFPWTRPWGEELRGFLFARLGDLSMGLLHALPGLFTVAVIILATRFVIRVTGLMFDAVEQGRLTLPFIDADTAHTTRRLVAALLWIFCVVVAYPFLPGSGTDAFKGVSVFVGLMVTLGSSGLMNQVLSGLVITYSRSVGVGDYARAGEVEGTVTALGVLSTKIRTPWGEQVTIPNAVVVAQGVTNYSRPPASGGVYAATSVTIGYDAPWRQVHALLLAAAGRTAGLLAEPAAKVLQTALEDFYVKYTLLVSLEQQPRRVMVLAELRAHIQDLFNEHGVQIMSPHYRSDPAAPKVVPKAQWFAPPAKPDG